jgi:hypothetical protein
MKSIYQTLGEVTEQLADAGKFKQYVEASKSCTTIESKIACAESILKTVVKKTAVKEAVTKKNNGAADNGGELITESGGSRITETAFAKTDELLYAAMNLSESDKRKLKNLPPVGSPNLTSTQLREYRLMRSYRIGEADSVRLALKVA